MKRTFVRDSCLRTCETTSTTGPHVLLVQNFGVANVTTNGTCAAIACATDVVYRCRSGCVAVVSGASLPPVVASVGVLETGALVPTAGEYECRRTMTLPRPLIAAPRGLARTQYLPAA